MNQNYIVIRREAPKSSKSNEGHKYHRIHFQGCKDNLIYNTDLDNGMENFNQWQKVIDSDQRLIVSGLKVTPKAFRKIDADSIPVIVGVDSKNGIIKSAKKTPQFFNIFTQE